MVDSLDRAEVSDTEAHLTGGSSRTAKEEEFEILGTENSGNVKIDGVECESVEGQPKRDRSDSGNKMAKKLKTDPDIQIVEHCEQWVEKDDDFVFDKTKIIIRQGDSVFMATTDKMESGLRGLDVGALERIRIPPENFCPEFKEGLTQISVPYPGDIYVKRPRLISWHPKDGCSIAALVLQEAEVCETLKKHPHPNIAQYHGCLVEDGIITGLCFTKYESSLEEALTERNAITMAEKIAYSKAIEGGICHLHQLGLAHNDINPSNIMMDARKPVIIDFDSSRPIGEKLGTKVGTFEWELEGAEFSEAENDFYGLRQIQDRVLHFKPEPI